MVGVFIGVCMVWVQCIWTSVKTYSQHLLSSCKISRSNLLFSFHYSALVFESSQAEYQNSGLLSQKGEGLELTLSEIPILLSGRMYKLMDGN